MAKNKTIKIGVDLDGVIAKHGMGGLWVWLRKCKERLIKKNKKSSPYYYPGTIFERWAWKMINWQRQPAISRSELERFKKEKNMRFYLVTSRYQFLEKLTMDWLKKYQLDDMFEKVRLNVKDEDPLKLKMEMVNKYQLVGFVDDGLEVIEHLSSVPNLKLFWIPPAYLSEGSNGFDGVKICQDLKEALERID